MSHFTRRLKLCCNSFLLEVNKCQFCWSVPSLRQSQVHQASLRTQRARGVDDKGGQAWQPGRRHTVSAEETCCYSFHTIAAQKLLCATKNQTLWNTSETESSQELGGKPGKGVWKREYSGVREFPGISTNFHGPAVWGVIPSVSPECKIWQQERGMCLGLAHRA